MNLRCVTWGMFFRLAVCYHRLNQDRYDIGDYRKVNPTFGTMADFELLVQETHRRGLKIILDIALNHTASTVSLSAAILGETVHD